MSKRLGAVIIVSAIVALTLTGCAGRSTTADRASANATAFTITTPSGRVVECIAYDGGLSCDWGRAQ